jgi:hypothetical protein
MPPIAGESVAFPSHFQAGSAYNSVMLTLTRRMLVGSIPAIALLAQIGRSQAAVQPAILQNEFWFRPGARDFADRLRDGLLSGPASCHFIGAHRIAGTAKYPLTTCYTMEVAYDGLPPDGAVDQIRESILADLVDDLQRHRTLFTHDRPIPLVALDGYMVINIWTFQPEIRFYIEWNGVSG